MIPLRSTERTYSTAHVVRLLIGLNVLIFLYQVTMDPDTLVPFVERWGIVPDTISQHLYSLFTSMFLHGGWLHVLGNMLLLWVFGRNVEDLIGSGPFLGFYLCCGLAAALLQVVTNPYSHVPTIGASGAIAGVMGAYLIKFPRARIVTLVPIIIFITTLDIPAAFLLLYWFAIQFFSGVGSVGYSQASSGDVACVAHIRGFLPGMALVMLMPTRQRRP